MNQQEPPGDSHTIDIASLAQELREQPAAADSSVAQLGDASPICIIAEVGSLTRKVDPNEYNPHHVSIGPYHRTLNPNLARDDEKKRSLRDVMSAASPGVTVQAYLEELVRLEGRARKCYEHLFEGLTSTAFVRMLLLDACYVLARFRCVDGYAEGRRRNVAATATANGHVQDGYHSSSAAGGGDMLEDVAVVRDVLYLAENQIPFFIIEKIHQMTILDRGVSAASTIAAYVRELLQQYSVAMPNVAEPPGPGNLLHLLHMHFMLTILPSATGADAEAIGEKVGRWRTATDYYFAGVKFRRRPLRTDEAQCILDVRLDSGGGTLEIPQLNIDAETWRLLRNLMALEQHNPAVGSNVTAYCVFMSQLACTAKDVELLSRRGVISHGLGNHTEVASFFTDLCKGIVFRLDDPDRNYLMATCQALEKQFRSRARRWMAWLRQKYFSNPWLAVGLAAAAIGLACAVVQAVYSVLSYRH
ncbi:UPF0481 protein At3g47200-like [Phragmites australis]|uniref:UPF0481 protein At3g47200-like n=1 Tax=Phragmites australis TaxID=29695 RepID=UPI002D77A206|nr:UPF0481 protein At3g47200-like [Phragmites australis]